MDNMFEYATLFNKDLNQWNVSNVTSMDFMFRSATSFNQPLNNWNVSNVKNMVYMFYGATLFNQNINNWDVSNVINMRGMFYGAITFNQNINNWDVSNVMTMGDMFYEAMHACNLDLNTLPKEFSYSFVLQHPENRIVVPIWRPLLCLVAVYSYHQGADVNHRTVVKSHDLSDFVEFNSTLVNVPATYDLTTYEEFAEKTKTLDYTYLGVMLTNPATGERTKIRNPNYEKVRHLKGNHPKLQYQYLCLRKAGKISQYLHYYPESNKEFAGFRDKVHEFTRKLRDNYISCYIRKERPLMEYSDEYRTHMYSLHQIYKNNLKPNGKILVFDDVVNYVNELHPNLLMHSLNYDQKKGYIKKPKVSEQVDVSEEPSTEEAV
jgi:surface protein